MKTLCPKCFNKDNHECFKCAGEGYVNSTFREGLLFTQYCLECGFENGGNIINEENPLLLHWHTKFCTEDLNYRFTWIILITTMLALAVPATASVAGYGHTVGMKEDGSGGGRRVHWRPPVRGSGEEKTCGK